MTLTQKFGRGRGALVPVKMSPLVGAFLLAVLGLLPGTVQSQDLPGPAEKGSAPSGEAGAPVLGLPLRCSPGADCWIVNYVDMAPGPDRRDYACGPLTYDGHEGTDFALRGLAEMRAGVDVVAAAPGIVAGTRDGMADINVREVGRQSLAGCGNGVRIDHGEGWFTQYCHLMKDSVAVRRGQRLAAGDVLGQVGLSGDTEFPHVHIQVARGETIVDPFAGTSGQPACGLGSQPLWEKALLPKLAYRPTAIYNLGFATGAVDWDAVREGRYRERELPASAAALVLWAEIFGVQAGDKVTLTIVGPAGDTLYARDDDLSRTQARRFIFSGLPRAGALWPPGTYRGSVVVARPDDPRGPGRYAADTTVEIK